MRKNVDSASFCFSRTYFPIKHGSLITYFANDAYFRSGNGPVSNTFSAVSANPSDGTLAFLQTSCEVFTC